MRPVALALEPAAFHTKVRIPGNRSIREKCGQVVPPEWARKAGKPNTQVRRKVPDGQGNLALVPVTRPEDLPPDTFKPYWTAAIPWLLQAYSRICAFCCFRIHETASPSVDHMVPKSTAWDKVYEWSNYRLASLRLNAAKGAMTTVIDPFDVKPGWFELEFTFGQIRPGPVARADERLKARVDTTIDVLGLNSSALVAARMRDISAYEDSQLRIRRLREESPFVADEIIRQGRLWAGDVP